MGNIPDKEKLALRG